MSSPLPPLSLSQWLAMFSLAEDRYVEPGQREYVIVGNVKFGYESNPGDGFYFYWQLVDFPGVQFMMSRKLLLDLETNTLTVSGDEYDLYIAPTADDDGHAHVIQVVYMRKVGNDDDGPQNYEFGFIEDGDLVFEEDGPRVRDTRLRELIQKIFTDVRWFTVAHAFCAFERNRKGGMEVRLVNGFHEVPSSHCLRSTRPTGCSIFW